jgi:16S rRNA processing protein RimM
MISSRILLGRIGRAQGLKGEVRLTSFTGDPLAIASYGPLESADGSRRFEIERISQRNEAVVASFKGITTREAAEALTNQELWIAREKLAVEIEEDEFLLADLVGCTAHAPDGRNVGTVVDVPNYGAGDLIEIALFGAETAKNKTALLPFTRAFVPEVDVKGRRIVVDMPPDLLDE